MYAIATARQIRCDQEGRHYALSFNGRHHIHIDECGRETWDGESVLVFNEDGHGVHWVHESDLND